MKNWLIKRFSFKRVPWSYWHESTGVQISKASDCTNEKKGEKEKKDKRSRVISVNYFNRVGEKSLQVLPKNNNKKG